MIFDKFLAKGTSHKVCEDYINYYLDALVLSDGCSSSPDTNIGSFLITQHAIHHPFRKLNFGINFEEMEWFNNLKEESYPFYNNDKSFDATFLQIFVNDGFVNVYAAGDGIIFYKRKNEDFIHIERIEYTSNAPYYLNYTTDERRIEDYFYYFKKNKKLIHSYIKDKDTIIYSPETNIKETILFLAHSLKFEEKESDYIGISSDGLESFQKNTGENIPFEEVINKVLSFKTFGSNFILKRMNKVIKEFALEKIYHYDDISIGGIKF